MTTPEGSVSQMVGGRYWILVAIAVIVGLSLLLSFDFGAGRFGETAWSNFISAVQISTLVVVVTFFLWWVRRREG